MRSPGIGRRKLRRSTIDLERTGDYTTHRNLLTTRRAELDALEESIRNDPHHRVGRVVLADGTVADQSVSGLTVSFRVEDPTTVLLVDITELRR